MLSVSCTTHVDGPPDLVFAALANPETQLLYDGKTFAAIEQLSPGPVGKGTRFRAALRPVGTIEYECSDFDPATVLEHSAATALGLIRNRFTVGGSGDGARVVQTISLAPNVLGQLLSPIVKQLMEARVQSLNDRLKTFVRATSPYRVR